MLFQLLNVRLAGMQQFWLYLYREQALAKSDEIPPFCDLVLSMPRLRCQKLGESLVNGSLPEARSASGLVVALFA